MTAVGASKQEVIYLRLRERILSGGYWPGDRLVIDRLSKEFSVSPLPVREAIRRLEAEGLVVFQPNAGAQVTPADPSLYIENMTVLAVLEGYATAQAAARMMSKEIDVLDDETDVMVRSMERFDVLGFSRANQQFHQHIYDACGNPPLLELLDTIGRRLDAIRRTVFTHIPYRGLESINEHRHLVELMRGGGTPLEVELAAREHKMATVKAFQAWMAEHAQADATSH